MMSLRFSIVAMLRQSVCAGADEPASLANDSFQSVVGEELGVSNATAEHMPELTRPCTWSRNTVGPIGTEFATNA